MLPPPPPAGPDPPPPGWTWPPRLTDLIPPPAGWLTWPPPPAGPDPPPVGWLTWPPPPPHRLTDLTPPAGPDPPPPGWTDPPPGVDRQTKWNYYLPVVLRTRAVKMEICTILKWKCNPFESCIFNSGGNVSKGTDIHWKRAAVFVRKTKESFEIYIKSIYCFLQDT